MPAASGRGHRKKEARAQGAGRARDNQDRAQDNQDRAQGAQDNAQGAGRRASGAQGRGSFHLYPAHNLLTYPRAILPVHQ